MHTTGPLLTSFLTLTLTSALPNPFLISTISSLLSSPGVNPSALTLTPGQSIDFTKVDAAPAPIIQSVPVVGTSDAPAIQPASAAVAIATAAVVDSTASALSKILNLKRERSEGLERRDGDCSVQPDGTGPAVNSPEDTIEAWLGFDNFTQQSLEACTPDGYFSAFTNVQGSTQTTSYLGYITLDSYDTDACVAYCDALDGCQGVNIYFERDPSLDPNTDECPNPTSITNIKCARWGVPVSNETATNVGQWRAQFEVVITGSNGYNKLAPPPAVSGYTGPTEMPGAMLAPLDPTNNHDTYITYQYFGFGTGDGQIQYFNPEACTAACTATTNFDIQNRLGVDGQGAPAMCNQVVAYVLSDADVPQGMYCAMYTESWDPLYATNVGQYRENADGGEDFWSVSRAYGFVNETYAGSWGEICATGGCEGGSFQGGSCGGWGTGTC